MAPKNAPKAPKPQRSAEFDAGTRALRMEDMTADEQATAIKLVDDVSRSARTQVRARTKLADQEKADAAKAALPSVVNKPYRHEDAIQTRVDAVERAATQFQDYVRPGREHPDSVFGQNFYFEHRAEADSILPEGSHIGTRQTLNAASALSVNNDPANEKAALKGLVDAHHEGTVTLTPELAKAMASVPTNAKNPTPYYVPNPEHVGVTRPFKDIHPREAALLRKPEFREMATAATSGVDLGAIAKGGFNSNVVGAHSELQGTPVVSAYTNPKQTSYAQAHVDATPDTDEHREYGLRAANLADVVSGRVSGDQHMLDFYGLRDSNEGVLSNRSSTPADKHEKRASYNQPGAAYPMGSEIKVTGKSRTTRAGVKSGVGMGDTRVQADAVEHAVHQDAVHQAASVLQEKHNLQYTVPAQLVQSAHWHVSRTDQGVDTGHRQAQAVKTEDIAAAQEEATATNDRMKHNRGQQLELFP